MKQALHKFNVARNCSLDTFVFAAIYLRERPIRTTGTFSDQLWLKTPFVVSLLRVLKLTIVEGKIVEVDVVADPARLGDLDFAVLHSTGTAN